tara:strand:- start:42 stop:563 length:522 start_codon:yes stop_codon:yes gene_type:complete
MNIDFNRICKLAGLANGTSSRSSILRESRYDEADYMHEEEDHDGSTMDEEETDENYGMMEADEDADEGMMYEDEDEDQDEMVEVDVSELMSEIRRAKNIMAENKRRSQRARARKQRIQENSLKRTIAREVQNVLAEMEDHDSSWLYGERKPRHSKKGHTNQGRTIPGIGFRKY